MLSIILMLLAGFICGEGLGYALHRFLHSTLSGRFHQAHMTHHLKLYPPEDFYSEIYRDPGRDNTVLIFGSFLLVISVLLFVFLPITIALIISLEFLALGIINDHLHDSFHIHPIWLERYKWFQGLRLIHVHHHQDMTKNFGIFSFIFDRLFKTYHN